MKYCFASEPSFDLEQYSPEYESNTATWTNLIHSISPRVNSYDWGDLVWRPPVSVTGSTETTSVPEELGIELSGGRDPTEMVVAERPENVASEQLNLPPPAPTEVK